MKKIDSNIAINGIEYSKDGKDLIFHFLNTYNGEYIYSLVFQKVYHFKYQNLSPYEDDSSYARFVADIYEEKFDTTKKEIFFLVPNFLNDKDLILITLFSGSLEIEIVCESYKKIILKQ